jgi:hypothetical protein
MSGSMNSDMGSMKKKALVNPDESSQFRKKLYYGCTEWDQLILVKSFLIDYIAARSWGSAKLTGGAPGLQIRCGAVKAVPGGFDSHALPPSYEGAP